MEITAKMVFELREKTSAPMMDCKKALQEVNGDFEKAVDWLRKKGLGAVAKLATRGVHEGRVGIHMSGDTAVIYEVNCETDFVANAEGFIHYLNDVGVQLSAQAFTPDLKGIQVLSDFSVMETGRVALSAKIGENIVVRRATKVSTKGFVVADYIHQGAKVAVIVCLKGGDVALARQVAMHIAAMKPKAASSADLPKELVEKEAAILREKAMQSGKPEAIVEKMVEGGLRNFYKESCLLEQSYVINPEVTVAEALKQAKAELACFVCFVLGEGLEKKTQDFAAEVAATVAQAQGQAS